MTCRHGPGDRNCTTQFPRGYSEPEPKTPDASNYSIEDFERVGTHLVLKVKYPNCAKCSYEGNKVMVFLNVTELQVLRWKKIDPQFGGKRSDREAPSPSARFPASPEGWVDALAYARGKC